MNNEVYQEIYGHILNDAQRIRKEIMGEWGDILMFGGSMPQNVVDELSTAARITGLAFDALGGHGVLFKQVPEKPDLYSLTVRDESYVCHTSAIPSMSGFLDVVNISGVSPQTQPASSITGIESPISKDNIPIKEENESSEETASEDIAETVEEFAPDTKKTPNEEVEDNTEAKEDLEDELIFQPRTAEVIGNTKIASLNKKDLFIEEYSKQTDDIIYEMFDIAMTHSGYAGGGKPEELQIMIAPLKIQKFACPSVPIIVSIYHKGKIITKSSYDQSEDGKNLVTMDVNEFYLLFRGAFDANGEFRGYITTTGISASQGDVLNVISNEKFGKCDGRNVNNGHIKIKSILDDKPGTVEAFPFGDPENNEFIVATKNDEFVDYLYISNSAKGLKKALIFTESGAKKQVVCSWDEDYTQMSLELKEV